MLKASVSYYLQTAPIKVIHDIYILGLYTQSGFESIAGCNPTIADCDVQI